MFTGLLQPTHLIILLVIALVFLGPKRLPDAGRALGQGLKEFKNSIGVSHDEGGERLQAVTITHDEATPAPVDRQEAGDSANTRTRKGS